MDVDDDAQLMPTGGTPRVIAPFVHVIVTILLVIAFVVFLWKFIRGLVVTPVLASFRPFVNGKPVVVDAHRVGVPGGRPISYKQSEIFHWVGSSFQAAASSYSLLLHLCVWGITVEVIALTGPHQPLYSAVKIDKSVFGAINFITTFTITTYLGQVMGRFHERFKMAQGANGAMHFISCAGTAMFPSDKKRVATLIRYALLIMHINYFAVFGPVSDARWATLRERKLITAAEESELRKADKKTAVVYVWAVRIVHEFTVEGKCAPPEANQLKSNLISLTGGTGKQNIYANTPVSFAYFHLMCVMVHVFLGMMIWNSSLRLHDDLLADDTPLGNFEEIVAVTLEVLSTFALLIFFNTLQVIAFWLSNPYGDDATDYDLDFDLVNLWKEAQEVRARARTRTRVAPLPNGLVVGATSYINPCRGLSLCVSLSLCVACITGSRQHGRRRQVGRSRRQDYEHRQARRGRARHVTW